MKFVLESRALGELATACLLPGVQPFAREEVKAPSVFLMFALALAVVAV